VAKFPGISYPRGMNDLNQHYRDLLGLSDSWQVRDVDLDLPGNQVTISLSHAGGELTCPDCGEPAPKADTAPERTWRHLDTMQFATEIRAAIPRCKCAKCGVRTIAVPWGTKHSRFTLMFEAFAIRVLQASANVKKGAGLLGISWSSAHRIMEDAVERGLERRDAEPMPEVGVDEKSFGKGQDYITVLTDTNRSRVVEIAEGRTTSSCDQLWNSLTPKQRESVQAVAMDMWQAFMTSTRQCVPQAKIVHDKFHVAKYLGEAVDRVRRAEHKELNQTGDSPLKGLRQLFLYNEENLDEDSFFEVLTVQRADLKTGRAWAIKENFRHFWNYSQRGWAKRFFTAWYSWAIRSRLQPIKKVAKMLKRHLDGLLNYFNHRVTNATAEGFNSRIQSIKSAARGFRCFENYRIRILFYCGKLNMTPVVSH
jgi:transposase